MTFKTFALLLCGVCMISSEVHAKSPHLAVEQKEFLESYMNAFEDNDFQAYESLIHPGSRACMGMAFYEYTQNNFEKRVEKYRSYQMQKMDVLPLNSEAFEQGLAQQFRNQVYLPVTPQYEFQVQFYQRAQYQDICSKGRAFDRLNIAAKFEKNQWYEVLPCPKSGFEDVMRHNLKGIALQEERDLALYENVPAGVWDLVDPFLKYKKDKQAAVKIMEDRAGLRGLKAFSVVEKRCEVLTQELVH